MDAVLFPASVLLNVVLAFVCLVQYLRCVYLERKAASDRHAREVSENVTAGLRGTLTIRKEEVDTLRRKLREREER